MKREEKSTIKGFIGFVFVTLLFIGLAVFAYLKNLVVIASLLLLCALVTFIFVCILVPILKRGAEDKIPDEKVYPVSALIKSYEVGNFSHLQGKSLLKDDTLLIAFTRLFYLSFIENHNGIYVLRYKEGLYNLTEYGQSLFDCYCKVSNDIVVKGKFLELYEQVEEINGRLVREKPQSNLNRIESYGRLVLSYVRNEESLNPLLQSEKGMNFYLETLKVLSHDKEDIMGLLDKDYLREKKRMEALFDSQNYEECAKIAYSLKDKNDLEAMVILGMCHELGLGREKNLISACQYYQMAEVVSKGVCQVDLERALKEDILLESENADYQKLCYRLLCLKRDLFENKTDRFDFGQCLVDLAKEREKEKDNVRHDLFLLAAADLFGYDPAMKELALSCMKNSNSQGALYWFAMECQDYSSYHAYQYLNLMHTFDKRAKRQTILNLIDEIIFSCREGNYDKMIPQNLDSALRFEKLKNNLVELNGEKFTDSALMNPFRDNW